MEVEWITGDPPTAGKNSMNYGKRYLVRWNGFLTVVKYLKREDGSVWVDRAGPIYPGSITAYANIDITP